MSTLHTVCELAGLDLLRLSDAIGDRPLQAVTWEPLAPEDDIDPSPVQVQLIVGDPGEVVLTLFDDTTVEVAEFAVRWIGSHTPQSYRRHGAIHVDGENEVERTSRVVEAIRALRTRRRKRFRRCKLCRAMTPPEWWHGEGYCQSCVERHLGVVN